MGERGAKFTSDCAESWRIVMYDRGGAGRSCSRHVFLLFCLLFVCFFCFCFCVFVMFAFCLLLFFLFFMKVLLRFYEGFIKVLLRLY